MNTSFNLVELPRCNISIGYYGHYQFTFNGRICKSEGEKFISDKAGFDYRLLR